MAQCTPAPAVAAFALMLMGCASNDRSDTRQHSASSDSAIGAEADTKVSQKSPADCGVTTCDIQLRHVVTLSDTAAPGLFGNTVFVQRSATGRFYSTTLGFQQIAVFDADGTFLTTLGRRGTKPSEFQFAMLTGIGLGDSIVVHDPRQGRLSVLDADGNITISRSFRYFPQLRLPDGSLIVAERIATPEHIGHPVHRLSAGGQVLRSFGADTVQYRPDLAYSLSRIVGPAPAGAIWIARRGQYVLEKWDPVNGEKLRVLRPRVPWFREAPGPSGHPFVSRPASMITQIGEDSLGLLWVFGMDADPNWKQRLPREPLRESREMQPTIEQRNEIYDWTIEVFRVNTGKHLAHYRSGVEFWIRPPNVYLVTRGQDEHTNVSFDVWQPTLVQGGRR